MCMITRSTAYKFFNKFNAIIPGDAIKKRDRGAPQKLFPEHSVLLVHFLPVLWRCITEKCSLFLKQASKYTLEMNASQTIKLRHEIASEWKVKGVDF